MKIGRVAFFLSLIGVGSLSWAGGVTDYPEQCFSKKQYPCSIKSDSLVHDLKFGVGTWTLNRGAALYAESQSDFKVLHGVAWLNTKEEVKILSVGWYLSVSGDVYFDTDAQKKLVVKNFDGSVKLVSDRFKTFSDDVIPVGFENWFSGLGLEPGLKSWALQRGQLSPIQTEKVFSEIIPMMSGRKATKLSKLQSYRNSWAGNVEETSSFYKQIALNRRAEAEAIVEKERARRLAEQRERSKLREMFKERNGLKEDSL